MFTKEEAHTKISELVERFAEQIQSYKRSDYNEAQTRQDFINPFFKALGWDVDNSQGNAEAYREVIHEDKLKIGSATKAPDYSFRLPGGKRLFFVEAKKPSVFVKEEIVPAYQVRRYGWSAKLPVSLITDFEELAVYDCTKKPDPADKASTARIKYFNYKQYLDEFDFIWNTFSKASVLKGSFDKFIVSDTHKKGTATVDKEFLASLDAWRILLAQNIALRNVHLTEDELNFVVQQTLDRIIFLRIAEDRGVEDYGELQQILSKTKEEGAYYKGLFSKFKEADSKYNSGLFDFKKDTISASVSIDNKVIKTVISELYYPVSPYEFSVLGVEILGSAYEQFLGKQIRLSAGHKAIIEEKPEVRKAGGVYYTPQYIVDYIVENTVGKLIKDLEEKHKQKVSPTGGDVEGAIALLRIVDPACGSGSFLIGAYTYLLNWHLNHYKPQFISLSETATDTSSNIKTREAAIKDRNKLPLTPEGNLTTALKKQILLNNIYGVDIDTQAVEVTKLSLLLKCMEGETGSSINAQMRFGERILPTLDNNIKSGNSLIDVDFYDTEFDFGEEKKIKPFNWQQAFPKVFNTSLHKGMTKPSEDSPSLRGGTTKQSNDNAGFDAVIGNPPYRLMQPKDTPAYLLNYFKDHYTVAEFKIDLFHLFFQKGIRTLKQNGLLGVITPSSLLNNVYVENLREWLLKHCRLQIIALTKEKVFADADVFTSVFILEKNEDETENNKNFVKTTIELEKIKFYPELIYNSVLQERFKENDGRVWNILLNESNIRIIDKIKKNCNSLNRISLINRGLITGDRNKYFSTVKVSDKYVPILAGGDVFRYFSKEISEYVLFERPKTSGGTWDKEMHLAAHKILVRQIGSEPKATLIEQPIAVTGNVFTIRSNSLKEEKYILGILNSKLISYFWSIMFNDFKNTFPQVTIFSLNNIPIKPFKENELCNVLIENVSVILQLNKEKQQTTLSDKIEQLNTRIKYTDDKINKLVYQLYGLNEEEIVIVESK